MVRGQRSVAGSTGRVAATAGIDHGPVAWSGSWGPALTVVAWRCARPGSLWHGSAVGSCSARVGNAVVIAIQIGQHWAGASPCSLLPSLQLEIRAAAPAIPRLLQCCHQLQPLLTNERALDRLLALIQEPPALAAGDSQAWFRRWLKELLIARGVAQLLPPAPLPLEALPAGLDGPAPLPQDPAALWRCALLCHCEAGDLALVRELLRWSVACWSWCLQESPRPDGLERLAARLPARIRPPVKVSCVAMARALLQRRIPLQLELADGLMLLWAGLGENARRLSQKVTDRTSAWGLDQAKHKLQTKKRLHGAGLPVAAGGLAHDAEAALRMATELGYPLVTKPAAADQGRGVITGIADAQALRQAWASSAAHGSGVLLERQINGRDFRFLLVHGRLMAALERLPGAVVGDGQHSVAELLQAENERRTRTSVLVEGGETIRLALLALDAEAEAMLQQQNLTPQSRPAAGRCVRLRYSANFSMGGSVRECRAEMHPLNVLLLEKVARLFELDVVGVDVLAAAIDAPLTGNGGVICEVNGMPGVLPHLLAEPQRLLMAELAARLLPQPCTVPLVAVQGEGAAALITAIEAAVLPDQPTLLVLERRGIRQAGEPLQPVDGSTLAVQRSWLRDRVAAAVLLELNGRDLAAHGAAWPHPDLLILTSAGDDPLPPALRDWLITAADQVVSIDGVAEGVGQISAAEACALAVQRLTAAPRRIPEAGL